MRPLCEIGINYVRESLTSLVKRCKKQPTFRFLDETTKEITQLLEAVGSGDEKAKDRLWERVYDELRTLAAQKMAQERPEHTLQPTALVNEVYIRLNSSEFENRRHFFGAAAKAMGQILVDEARRKNAEKRPPRGGGVSIDDITIAVEDTPGQIIAVQDALLKMEQHYPEETEIVSLRYFLGFKQGEIGKTMGISIPTVKRRWAFARAWLRTELGSEDFGNKR